MWSEHADLGKGTSHMAYTRRGFKGGVRATTLNGSINDGVTTIAGSDLSTWSGVTTNGPGTATISQGQSDEETITFTGVSSNNLTGVTRGAAGTTAQSHASGASLDHTSSVTDFDEANAHIADTTLDHHTHYARTDGTRNFTGAITVVGEANKFGVGAGGAAGTYVEVDGTATETFVQAKGTPANIPLIVRAKGTSDVVVQTSGGVELARVITASVVNSTSFTLAIDTGAGYTLKRVEIGAGDSGGAGFRMLRVTN